MHKTFLCTAVLCTFAWASDVELLATHVDSSKDKIVAQKDVLAIYEDFYMMADKVVYDKNSSTLELFGDIHILKGSTLHSITDHAFVNLKDKSLTAEPFFFLHFDSNIWFAASSAQSREPHYTLVKSTVSSCNPENPDWRFVFSKGTYNEKKEWVNLFNVRLYAGDIPLFYFPYFGFSTVRERKSGLLRPEVGLSSEEGFLYMQPIYFAPKPQWDLELEPQLRSNRGEGLYATLRFVDSADSRGEIKVGGFFEDGDYSRKYDLKNEKHLGIEVDYENNGLLEKRLSDVQDGLYLDATWLNDIDYLNMQHKKALGNTDSIVTSRLNYALGKDDHYLGLYAKYFIDTTKTNNDDTLQLLPSVQYHKHTSAVLADNLLYSVDYKLKNHYRQKDLNALQHEFDIPVGLYLSFWDDYLNFSATENIYLTHIDYSNTPTDYEAGRFFRNYHKLSLFSDLVKPYENFFHVMQLSASYILPSIEEKKGYFADFIALSTEEKRLELALTEFFYDGLGSERLYHRIAQPFYYSNDRYRYGVLENEFLYRFNSAFELYSSLFYSHEEGRFSSFSASAHYNKELHDLVVSYFHQDDPSKEDADFVSLLARVKTSRIYELFGTIDYDFYREYTRRWKVGWSMRKRCWDYTFSVGEETKPILTSAGSSAITNKVVYLQINLVPLGGIEQKFEQEIARGEI